MKTLFIKVFFFLVSLFSSFFFFGGGGGGGGGGGMGEGVGKAHQDSFTHFEPSQSSCGAKAKIKKHLTIRK